MHLFPAGLQHIFKGRYKLVVIIVYRRFFPRHRSGPPGPWRSAGPGWGQINGLHLLFIFVHLFVRFLEQIVHQVVMLFGADRKPTRVADRHLLRPVKMAGQLLDPFQIRLHHRFGAVFNDRDKFIPAEPRKKILFIGSLTQQKDKILNQLIPLLVSPIIVHLLQIVEIEHDKADVQRAVLVVQQVHSLHAGILVHDARAVDVGLPLDTAVDLFAGEEYRDRNHSENQRNALADPRAEIHGGAKRQSSDTGIPCQIVNLHGADQNNDHRTQIEQKNIILVFHWVSYLIITLLAISLPIPIREPFTFTRK